MVKSETYSCKQNVPRKMHQMGFLSLQIAKFSRGRMLDPSQNIIVTCNFDPFFVTSKTFKWCKLACSISGFFMAGIAIF